MPKATSESPKKQTGPINAVFRGDASYTFVRAIYGAGGSFGWRQPAYQLVVILQGAADIGINGDHVTLREGEGILMHPGWEVSYLFSKDRRSTHTGCQVENTFLEKADLERLGKVFGIHRVPSAVHTLIGEGLNSPVTAGSQLHGALAVMAKACLLRFAAEVSESPEPGKPPHPALSRAFEALEADPTGFTTAGALAGRCGVSVSRLRQIFRAAGHDSPSAMIWRIKTEHALQMIRSTAMTLGEIADRSGFTNPFHLSRSVKKHTGQTPKKIRGNEQGFPS
jgi:AraC-like DNA-binding protein